MMSEEVAKERWCPMTRNRRNSSTNVYPGHCIGSECMAWRWGFEVTRANGATHIRNGNNSPMGYCGLAGKEGD